MSAACSTRDADSTLAEEQVSEESATLCETDDDGSIVSDTTDNRQYRDQGSFEVVVDIERSHVRALFQEGFGAPHRTARPQGQITRHEYARSHEPKTWGHGLSCIVKIGNDTQNIVTNLGKGSRQGLTDGLRDYFRVDNHRALDVGELHRGTGTFKVRKPKVPEGGSDVTVRESPDELTVRAEEVKTSKAYIDANHIKAKRWGPPLVDADWSAFCQALYEGIEGKDWEDMSDSYKIISKAVWVSKKRRRLRRQEPCGP